MFIFTSLPLLKPRLGRRPLPLPRIPSPLQRPIPQTRNGRQRPRRPRLRLTRQHRPGERRVKLIRKLPTGAHRVIALVVVDPESLERVVAGSSSSVEGSETDLFPTGSESWGVSVEDWFEGGGRGGKGGLT